LTVFFNKKYDERKEKNEGERMIRSFQWEDADFIIHSHYERIPNTDIIGPRPDRRGWEGFDWTCKINCGQK
jgi:hypothetical protein